MATAFACEGSSDGDAVATGGTGTGGQSAPPTGGASGGMRATGGSVNGTPTGGTVGSSSGGAAVGGTSTTGGAAATGGSSAGGTPNGGGGSAGTGTAAGNGGQSVAGEGGIAGGAGGGGGGGGQVGGQSAGSGGGSVVLPNSCMGKALPSADPTKAGPFQVAADKNVGPLAGAVPDPIYGDKQQRFNVYRPSNLADSGYCHPILVWANGFQDNPEQNPPDCIVDQAANRWCGQYLPMLNHLASHGFVVIASLSTKTAEGNPLPTIAGLDWILEQAEDSSSKYYHRLDTANIGQLGHSYGGMSTCLSASEPRYKALATICGARGPINGVHTPMLFFCGGKDGTVGCDDIKDIYRTITDQPAFFLNEKNADHGSWVYQGANGVSLSAAAAWFRVHLMNDTANRKFFYGSGCTFCTDNRVEAEQNSLMKQ